MDTWARSVQPHPRLGINTSTSYTLTEIEDALQKVVLGPDHSAVPKKVKDTTEAPEVTQGSNELLGFRDIEEAITFARNNLREIKKDNGVRNKLPLDSITCYDLEMSQRDLFARVALVGAHVSSAKMASRISSQKETLGVKGVSDLQGWWTKSTAMQKMRLMMRSKYTPASGDGLIHISKIWLDKLGALAFPFRDAEAQVGPEEVETSAESGDSSDFDHEAFSQGATLSTW